MKVSELVKVSIELGELRKMVSEIECHEDEKNKRLKIEAYLKIDSIVDQLLLITYKDG